MPSLLLCRLLAVATFLLFPTLAQAHPGDTITFSGWTEGFNHPLHDWGHLIVMVAVGLWAAQQRGRHGWMIPCVFVCVMAVGC